MRSGEFKEKNTQTGLLATKYRLLTSVVFFLILLIFSKSAIQYLPSYISITLDDWKTGSFSVYRDTGKGFSESEANHRPYIQKTDKQATLYYVFTDNRLKQLRVDPGHTPGKVGIKNICLYRLQAVTCWAPSDIEREFIPVNDISAFRAGEESLGLLVTGEDPILITGRLPQQGFFKAGIINKLLIIILVFLLSLLVFYLYPVFLRPRESLSVAVRRCRRYTFHISLYQLSAVSILLILLLSGLWLNLDQLGFGVNLLLFLFLTFLAFYRRVSGRAFVFNPRHLKMPARPNLTSLTAGAGWGLLISAPVLIYLWLTWSQEFPYIGDNQYHQAGLISSYLFWTGIASSFALFFIITGLIAALLLRLSIWIPAAFILLFVSSYVGETPPVFLRYPGLGRAFGDVLMWLSDYSQWDSFFNILRTSNALAVVSWLFILRPLAVGRWPGPGILPFAFLFFYQQEVVYYFTSGYLEPWALIFVLLAVELLIVRKTVRAHCVAFLLVGLASLIKEQMIFILPFVWLASRPWVPGERLDKFLCVLASIVPFLIYYLSRKEADVSRGFSLTSAEQVFSVEKLSTFADRIQFHFGVTGILLIMAMLGLYLYLVVKPPVPRIIVLSLAAAGLFQIAFFYVDAGSVNYAGYPRFLLAAYLMLCASALFLPMLFKGMVTKRNTLLIAAGVFFLQGFMLVPYMLQTLKPDSVRNFSQHFDHPVFLPVAELIRQAEVRGVLRPGQLIYVSDPTGWDISSIKSDYTKLGRKYRFETGNDYRCQCNANNMATIAPFIYFGNLNRDLPENLGMQPGYARAPMDFYRRWREVNARRPQCIREIEASCRYSFTATADGELVGVMGVGEKQEAGD